MRLFVYGTLKRGFTLNEHTIGGDNSCRYIGEGKIEGFDMYSNGSYPYIVPVEDKSHKVSGEIWEVNDSVMMTRLRGIECEYQETTVQVVTELGVEDCIAYVYMRDVRESWTKIESGIFPPYAKRI